MKKLLLALTVLTLTVMTVPPTGWAEEYYPGEGYVTPTPKSLETFARTRADGTPGDEPVGVSVNAQDFPEIVLNVTVRDSEGIPVTGLTADDVTVTEQSSLEDAPVEETLTCFEESASNGGGAITFSLVFDVSQSMSLFNRLPDAKDAAIDFLNTSEPDDQGSLVSFSGCNEGGILVPVTGVSTDSDSDGTSNLAEELQALETIGLTSVYDGIGNGIESISDSPFPKGVIVFTDGNTNDDCIYTINEVIQKAQEEGTPVYTVGLELDENTDSFQREMVQRLRQIASETGGFYTAAPTAADMADIYRDIAQVIRNQYRICYTSHNPDLDGTTRTVAVTADGQTGTGTYTVGTGPGPDNRPPVIDHTPVATATAGTAVPISAQVTDPDGNLAQVTLFYRVRSMEPETPSYTALNMPPADGNTYRAEIPAETVTPAGVEYYVVAEDALMSQSQAGSAADPFVIDVMQDNQPPVADAGDDISVSEGAAVTLDATGSSDPNAGDTLTYEWMQTGGPDVPLSDIASPQPMFTAPTVGPEGAALTFELTVRDGDASATDTVTVMVNDTLAPAADFTWTPDVPAAGEPVNFMDQSTAAAAPITSWNWDFGGLGTSTEQNPVFTFPDSGTYTVQLQVADDDGSTGTTVQTITIAEPPCVGDDCGGGSSGCFIDSTRPGTAGAWDRLLQMVKPQSRPRAGLPTGR